MNRANAKTPVAKMLKLTGLPVSQIDRLVDKGHVWALMTNGSMWKVRRNGKTRKPGGEWEVPIKVGLKTCGLITAETAPCYLVYEGDFPR